MNIGHAMQRARKNAGMTAAALGAKAGVAPATIRHAEIGYSIPSLWTTKLLADALDLTIDEYCGFTASRDRVSKEDFRLIWDAQAGQYLALRGAKVIARGPTLCEILNNIRQYSESI